jgi:hypothetical protein
MRPLNRRVLIIWLLILLWLALVTLPLMNSYPLVSADKLFIQPPALPDHLAALDQSHPVTWKESDSSLLAGEDLETFDPTLAAIAWHDTRQPASEAQVHQLVLNYFHPVLAMLQYARMKPAHSDMLDVNNSESVKLVTQGRLASQEEIVCLKGTQSTCNVWYYWARYGQYIIRIRLSEPAQGTDLATFNAIIAQLDTKIQQQLAR